MVASGSWLETVGDTVPLLVQPAAGGEVHVASCSSRDPVSMSLRIWTGSLDRRDTGFVADGKSCSSRDPVSMSLRIWTGSLDRQDTGFVAYGKILFISWSNFTFSIPHSAFKNDIYSDKIIRIKNAVLLKRSGCRFQKNSKLLSQQSLGTI